MADLRRPPIRVLSVADVVRPWTTGIAPTMYGQVLEAYAADLREAKADTSELRRKQRRDCARVDARPMSKCETAMPPRRSSPSSNNDGPTSSFWARAAAPASPASCSAASLGTSCQAAPHLSSSSAMEPRKR